MARPSKLTPEQWADIERRLSAGESAASLAREHGINQSQITRRVTQVSQTIRNVAIQVAEAQTALATLPAAQQYTALTMADEIRGLQQDVLAATRLGAKSGLRLHAIANSELQKVDDANPQASQETLRGVAVLTKMANESMTPALTLLAANKETVKRLDDETAETVVQRVERVIVDPANPNT